MYGSVEVTDTAVSLCRYSHTPIPPHAHPAAVILTCNLSRVTFLQAQAQREKRKSGSRIERGTRRGNREAEEKAPDTDKKRGRRRMATFLFFLAKIATTLIFRLGFHIEVRGTENIPKKGPFIVAANHMSFLDPPIVGCVCPRRLCYFARYNLFKNSSFGALIRQLGAIPLERSGMPLSMRKGLYALRDGKGLVIFPEGTRVKKGDPSFGKPGVGLLAVRSGAPVIPSLIIGTDRAFPPRGIMIKPVHVCVVFGKPAFFKQGDYTEIGGKVMGLIRDLE